MQRSPIRRGRDPETAPLDEPLLDGEDASRRSGPSELSRTIGVRGVVLIGLFWVTGGFFGNESLVELAPRRVALVNYGPRRES